MEHVRFDGTLCLHNWFYFKVYQIVCIIYYIIYKTINLSAFKLSLILMKVYNLYEPTKVLSFLILNKSQNAIKLFTVSLVFLNKLFDIFLLFINTLIFN